jgi:hypothetical protein
MSNHNKKSICAYISTILLCTVFSILISQYNVPWAIGVFIGLSTLALMFVWPEIGTLAVMSCIYGNFLVVAVRFHGVPQISSISIPLILCIPLAHYLFIDHDRFIIDRTFLLMLAFLVSIIGSSFFAQDLNFALDWITTFVQEGLVLYLLIINVVRKFTTLRRVIWVLMCTGAFLGALSLYQELTGAYQQQFGGLAIRALQYEAEESMHLEAVGTPQTKIRVANRAQGSIDDPNRYAQTMLYLLPLALFQFWGTRSRKLQLSAAITGMLILCGVLLSYSRGAFLTMILLLLVMVGTRYIRFSRLLIAGVILLLSMAVVAPGYFMRIESISGIAGLVSDEAEARPDAPTRGRLTEMLAALTVFLDHPLLGVGPEQYLHFYSKDYQQNPDIAFRHIDKDRRAHTLYFEMAAETGIIGLSIFMAIVLLVLYELWQARCRWAHSRPELANTAMACFLGLIAYLGTATFLHFSFQRYYWLLLALAGATLQICRLESLPQDELPAIPPDAPQERPQEAVQVL